MQNLQIGEVIPKEEIERLEADLADCAFNELMEPGEDYDEIESMTIAFGFLYLLEDLTTALFRITTDKKTIYFSQQGDMMNRLPDEHAETYFTQMAEVMRGVNGRYVKIG